MNAGAARVDITPPPGTHLAGDGMGRHRPARKILDPLYASVLLLEAGGRRACIISLDLLCVAEPYTSRIRALAAETCGVEPDAVVVHSVQNHASPSLGPLMFDPDFPVALSPETEYLTGAETAYGDFAMARIGEALARAPADMAPVQLGLGRGLRDGLAHNRRAIRRDGSVCMPWFGNTNEFALGPTHLLRLEGPDDPEVGVAALRRDDMRLAALMLTFACHPVNMFALDKFTVTADWPGAWAAGMRKRFGEACTPLVLNGCCGNLNPWPAFRPDFHPDHARMGAALTETATTVLEHMHFAEPQALDWRMRRIPLAYNTPPPERMRAAEAILAAHPTPMWDASEDKIDLDWFNAASAKSIDYCRRRMPEFVYEMQALRIGDMALVALPGEPFVEGQLAIKLRSPATFTAVAHMCSHYVGYIPTRDACTRGGHETHPDGRYWAKLAPDSLERIVDAAVAMLDELFDCP